MLWCTPAEAGFSPGRLDRAWAVLRSAAGTESVPAAVAAVGRGRGAVVPRAFGWAVYTPEDERVAAAPDTPFDLASLTKAVATAPATWALIERGRLRLADRVAEFLPAFGSGAAADPADGRAAVTVAHLLTHTAGLPAHAAMPAEARDDPDRLAWAAAVPLAAAPGQRCVYSDVGFMILGRVVEAVAGRPLHDFCRDVLFQPLGMAATCWNPPAALAARAAATEWLDGDPAASRPGGYLRGVVHDWKARWAGRACGHAGLFSTAPDLAVFADMLLHAGRGGAAAPRRVLSAAAVEAMTKAVPVGDGIYRTRGWDGPGRAGLPPGPGDLWTRTGFGHTGFTGTSLWIDPGRDVWVVLLTNAIHLRREAARPTMTRLRRYFHNAVVAALGE